MNLIKIHGFEKIVCKNFILHEMRTRDLDNYIAYLRNNLKPQLIERIRKLKESFGSIE